MIDEQWLASLHFQAYQGLVVTGLVDVGSEAVILAATDPDGKELVLKVRKHHLGFHIRELPLFLTDRPAYDVSKVNRKLASLVGEPMLDTMSQDYDRLHGSVIRFLHSHGLEPLLMGAALRGMAPPGAGAIDPEVAIRFFLQTSGLKRRIRDWAEMSPDSASAAEAFVTVNGPGFAFTESRPRLIEWASGLLERIERLEPVLRPEGLLENPLYIWGAAVTDGFFTDEELPEVVSFLEQRYGEPFKQHPGAFIHYQQIKAIAHLLVNYLKDSDVDRLIRLCSLLGFPIDPDELRLPDLGGQDADEETPDSAQSSESPKRRRRRRRQPSPPKRRPEWSGEEFLFRRMGFTVASMHEMGSLHGDLHLDNLEVAEGPLDDPRFVVFDLSQAKIVDRPATARERARDMIKLRAECSVSQWKAFAAGYLDRSPRHADAIRLLEGDLADLLDRPNRSPWA